MTRRALFAVSLAGGVLAVILGLGLHVNLSPSAPRGLYRTVTGMPARGAWVVTCVSADAAALARARGYLLPGPCPGGYRLPASRSAAVDGRGDPLPHAARGRHVVGADEVWVVSTRVPNSWDSRYLGPIPTSQIRAVARPVWTVD